jgi:hypothetical protein
MKIINYIKDKEKPDYELITTDKEMMGIVRLIKRIYLSNNIIKDILDKKSKEEPLFIENVLNKITEEMKFNEGILSKQDISNCIDESKFCGELLHDVFQKVYQYKVSQDFIKWEYNEVARKFEDLFYIIEYSKGQQFHIVYSQDEDRIEKYFKEFFNNSPEWNYRKIDINSLMYIPLRGYNTKLTYLKDTVYDLVKDINPNLLENGLGIIYVED